MDIEQAGLGFARQLNIGDLPRRTAARHRSKVAIIDGDRKFTFAEFEDAVERSSHAISAAGIKKGDRIALLSRNCWQFAVLNFAAARSGAIFVPINFMLKPAEVAYIIDDCAPAAFVVKADLLGTAEAALDLARTQVSHRLLIDGRQDLAGHPNWQPLSEWIEFIGAASDPVLVADDDPVRMMYTSGTESVPKGVMLSSRSLLAQYLSCIVDGGMTADDVDIHALPLYHCAQLDCFLSVDVYLGATSVILESPEPSAVLAAISEHRATKFFAPPTVWISLLRSPQFDETDLSTLDKGYYGASPMPVEVLYEIRKRLPATRLWNFYGQTELAPVAAILQPEDQITKAGAAGRPALNVETSVVDTGGHPVPPGVVGEIVHRSPQVTLGYYRSPDRTREAFDGGWFHSGDLGFFDDEGYLTVVDRKKDMIKSGGENVASREVEEVIYELDGIEEVAVFGISDPIWVEAVATAVVISPGSGITPERIRSYARTKLANYKVPKYIVLVDELPKNPSGKILKRRLRDEYQGLGAVHE